MRTWILMAAFVISETIRPEHEYSIILSVWMIVLFIAGFIMDFVDFQKHHKEV